MGWQHINLPGEYDFSDEKLKDSVGLRVPKILELSVTGKPGWPRKAACIPSAAACGFVSRQLYVVIPVSL